MRKPAIALFLLLYSLSGISQNKFLAYQVRGKASYTLQGKKQPLKTGKIVPETAVINVEDKSTVLMICEQASSPISLAKGSHRLSQFGSHCDPQAQSATANYLKYVWWQMTNPGSSSKEERNRQMSSVSGVSRGCPGVEFFVPDTLNYFEENILLTWKLFSPGSRSDFVLYQEAASPVPLLSLPMKVDQLDLDSIRKWMEPGVPYYWTIHLDGNEVCERKLIQYWDAENYAEHLGELKKQLIDGVSQAEQDYQLAFLLESEGFIGEAYKYYRQAKKASGDDRYKRTVIRFRELFREED